MKKITIFAGLGIFPGLFFLFTSSSPVIFESLESKTDAGNSVCNRIRFLPGWTKDIWLMQQTHQGLNDAFTTWDRLAIVVDKTKRPLTATFYQLSPGELKFEAQPVPYKARCLACHGNGPRAIRLDSLSSNIVPSFWGRMQTSVWNLRIKTYGPVVSNAASAFSEGVPFQSKHSIFSRPLGLKTCQKCHSANGIRNELRLEQIGTARFLIQKGYMPPFPFSVTLKEKELLDRYADLKEGL